MSKKFLTPLLILVFLSFFASSITLVSASPDLTCDVLFVAWDHSGHPLPDYGCKWYIKCENGTYGTFPGNQITLRLHSGEHDISVTWLGSWAVENYTWHNPCAYPFFFEVTTEVTDVTFTAYDQDGNPLYDEPCYWKITYPLPNGTTYSYNWASGNLKLANGTYYLRVMWQGTYVTGNTTWHKDVDTSYNMSCSVVDRMFMAKDHDGGQELWSSATSIWVRVPNGTWCTSPTNSSRFTLEKLGYEFDPCTIKVRFENTTVFEKTLTFFSDEPRTYDATCDVYQYTPRLLDQEGGPYGGAEIHLECTNETLKTLITDENGRVSIQQIQKGSYSIPEVIYNGHKVNQTDPFSIEGDLTDWTIHFNGLSINQTDYPALMHLNSTFTIRAQLVYSYSGEAISGGVVGLIGALEMNATTDTSGWVTFDGLSEWQPTGPFTVFGVNDSDRGLTYPVQNGSISVTWTGDFSVQALDADGHALNNASLKIYNGTDVYWKTAYTDPTGFIHVEDAVCQDYLFDVYWKGVDVGSVSLDLNRAVIDETVSCTAYYGYVRVNNITDSPLENVLVDVLWSSEDLYEAHQTNETGFTPLISQIPGGTYNIRITYSDATYETTVSINEGFEFRYVIDVVSIPNVPEVKAVCYSTDSNVEGVTYDQVFSEIYFEISGQDGTGGYISIFVPKAFLTHLGLAVDDIHVFYDDSPVIEYTVTEYGDGYLLRISYTHSSHTVEVVFSDAALTVRAKDSNDRAIDDARIKVYRSEVLAEEGDTNGDGYVDFTNLATGEYRIEAWHLGVLVNETQLTLSDYDEHYHWDLRCTVYDLTIRVFDMIPSSLPGASVTASLPDGVVLFSGTTNGVGNITFYQVPAEDYEVKATYFGASTSTDIVLNQNLMIQVCVPMLNMTAIVLIIVAIGATVTLIGVYYSKRGEEKPKRRRGRPRKIKTPI